MKIKSLFANIISPKVNECKRYKFGIITPMDNYFKVKTCTDPKSFSRGWGGGPRDIFVSWRLFRKFEFESTPLIRACLRLHHRGDIMMINNAGFSTVFLHTLSFSFPMRDMTAKCRAQCTF